MTPERSGPGASTAGSVRGVAVNAAPVAPSGTIWSGSTAPRVMLASAGSRLGGRRSRPLSPRCCPARDRASPVERASPLRAWVKRWTIPTLSSLTASGGLSVAVCGGAGAAGTKTAMLSAMPLGCSAERSCTKGARNRGCERVDKEDSKRAVCTTSGKRGTARGMAGSDRQSLSVVIPPDAATSPARESRLDHPVEQRYRPVSHRD